MAGELVAEASRDFTELAGAGSNYALKVHLEAHMLRGEQKNTCVVYGDRLMCKLFRKVVGEGINPDLEVGQFLTHTSATKGLPDAENFAPVAGSLNYSRKGFETMTLGMIQKFIPDIRDGWSYSIDSLRDFFERVQVRQIDAIADIDLPSSLLTAALETEIPDIAQEMLGSYLRNAQLLGERTAEMHLALASDSEDPNFAPEPFTSFYQRSIYQYMRNQAGQVLLLLKKHLIQLPSELQPVAQLVLNNREMILARLKSILNQKITAMRTRTHGNLCLNEVLYTGKDFIIIDFEGDQTRPLSERRMKRSPLRDVAGMIESFYYSSRIALRNEKESGIILPDDQPLMEQWAQFSYYWSSIAFLKSYFGAAKNAPFLPSEPSELQLLLDGFVLEKVIIELEHELKNRPNWVEVPMYRILELLETA